MNSLIATLEARKPQIAALLPKDELVATIRAATDEALTQCLTEPPRSVFGVKVPLIMDSEEMVPPGCAQAAYSWEIREHGRVIGRQHLIVRTPAEVTLTWDFRRFPEEANGIEPVIPRLDPEQIAVPMEFETFTYDEEGNELDSGMEYSPHFRLERASDLLISQKPDHTLLGIKVRVVPVLLDTSTGRIVHTRDTRNERKPSKESDPAPPAPKLELNRIDDGFYETPNGEIRVRQYKQKTWASASSIGRKGTYQLNYWIAYLTSASGEGYLGPHHSYENQKRFEVARGDTIGLLRKNLQKYLDDKSAGNLKTRNYYGWPGDQNPIAAPTPQILPAPPQTPIPVTPARDKTPIQIERLYFGDKRVYLGTGKNKGHWLMADQQGKFLVMPEQQHLSLEELKARGGEWIKSTWEARVAPIVKNRKSLVVIVDLGKGLLPYTATLDLKEKHALWRVRDGGMIYPLHPDSKSPNQLLYARLFENAAAEAGVGWIGGDMSFKTLQSHKAEERKSLSAPAKQAIDDLVLAIVKSYRSGADVPLIAGDLYENQGGVKNTLHLGDAYAEGVSVQFTPTEDDDKILFQISYDKNKRKEVIQASVDRLTKAGEIIKGDKDNKGRVVYLEALKKKLPPSGEATRKKSYCDQCGKPIMIDYRTKGLVFCKECEKTEESRNEERMTYEELMALTQSAYSYVIATGEAHPLAPVTEKIKDAVEGFDGSDEKTADLWHAYKDAFEAKKPTKKYLDWSKANPTFI